MKILKYLSALALLNLFAVGIITNFPASKVLATQIPTEISVKPTPQIVVRKVVKKIYKTVQGTAISAPSLSPTTQVSNVASTAPNPTQPPLTQNRCIIVIDGSQYDVTDFRNIHSGGNVFNCGSDMSQIFWNRHNASILARMQQYKI